MGSTESMEVIPSHLVELPQIELLPYYHTRTYIYAYSTLFDRPRNRYWSGSRRHSI